MVKKLKTLIEEKFNLNLEENTVIKIQYGENKMSDVDN
jgi:hypothetical protein